MKNIYVIMVIALLVAITLPTWAQDSDGAKLYKAKCAACHGDKGEGKPNMKMPAVKGTSMDVEKLVEYLTKGESEKTVHATPVEDLSAEQAKAIAEHVKSLQ